MSKVVKQHNTNAIVLSCSIVSVSLWPYGLQPARLLCPWGFSRQEYRSGLSRPPPGDLSNTRIEPRFPAFQADSLQTKSPGKPKYVYICKLYKNKLEKFICNNLKNKILGNKLPQGSERFNSIDQRRWAKQKQS